MSGCFITIEGGEGAGKSSNIAFIQQYLSDHGKALRLTREPGGTQLGEKIRQLLLDKDNHMDSDTELLLMFAARAQHLAEVIRPALAAGQWVLCDRFTDATYAYQGGGRGIAGEHIKVMEDWVQRGLKPDVTILLDVPVDIGLQRASARSEPDRFEQEKVAFFQRVRQAYLDLATRESGRFHVVDASQPLQQVQSELQRVLEEIMTRFP